MCRKKGGGSHVWAADTWLQTEEELKRICKFMNVTYSTSMLAYAQDTTYSSPDKSLISQWKHKDANKIKLIESKLKKFMFKYGCLDNKEGIKVSFILNYYLKICFHINKRLFSIHRYGIYLKL